MLPLLFVVQFAIWELDVKKKNKHVGKKCLYPAWGLALELRRITMQVTSAFREARDYW